MKMKKVLIFTTIVSCLHSVICDVNVSTHDLSLTIHDKTQIILEIANYTDQNQVINLVVQHTDIIDVNPIQIQVSEQNTNVTINIEAIGAGHSDVYANATNRTDLKNAYFRVTINKSNSLGTFSIVIGWIYFIAWSISFYPQIYINYKRKSVVGLNFDFLALNLVGFTLYSIFNLGLYFIPEIKDEYSNRFPRGLNPVQVNDIFFACHATIATVVTIIQCFLYERNNQKISITATVIIAVFGVFLFISIILAGTNVIHWLDYLYYCSYVKLAITLIKYIPQAYMNYNRKSTVGWSVANVLLDFTGGILSILQMLLNSYNYDDWASIFGDPTKFGLGLFSVIFDIFFIIQHYVLYKHTQYEEK